MDITLFIARFLYRIRYQMILGGFLVTALVAYFTQFLPKTYTVTTSIYTGIAYNSTLDDDKPNTVVLNNLFDNLINLTKAKGTLENVSTRLFAMNMIHGHAEEDNMYITAAHYNELLKIVPEEVTRLIDKNSFDKTIENLNAYKKEEPRNFLFELFNGNHPHYGYSSLSKTSVKRLDNSDLVEVSYQTNDPGIAQNTVKLIHNELILTYDGIRYRTVNDIIKHYEDELAKKQAVLSSLENDLTDYNVEQGVINYQEQTKALSNSYSEFNNRYEMVLKEYESSSELIKQLESQIETRTKLFRANTDFITTLNELSSINGKITEIETFNTADTNEAANKELEKYKAQLKAAELKISEITDQMDEFKYSKEGIAIDNIVNKWLEELLNNIRTKAELDVMNARRDEFLDQYKQFSPIGTQLSRREREIKVTEQAYLEIFHSLNVAKLKQKNLQLTSANLNTISPPTFPLTSDGNKRMLFIIASFIGSIIFIIGCNLVIELLDRTLRDAERTRRLTKLPVLGAFTGNIQLKYRGYIKACNRISATYICNRLNSYRKPGKTIYINVLSIEDREGKSFVSTYLLEHWEVQGLKVKYVDAGKDTSLQKQYLQAFTFKHILHDMDGDEDIVLIEHPAIFRNSIPMALLQQADVNILIANAQRVWKTSDDEFISYLKDMVGNSPLFIYLNNAMRETVEDFTGQLPPESSVRTLTSRIIYMGLTARETYVK